MVIFKKQDRLIEFLSRQKSAGKKIGFVPTMGALHAGHISLVEEAGTINDLVVCSIFINPTQFNNKDDFKFYPVSIEKDIEQLIDAGCDVLFLPAVDEVYPPGFHAKRYELGAIEERLEGFYRPGHFQGVCQVVDRFLDIVEPNALYLGQKDYQQCIVINKLISISGKQGEVALHIVPTVREKDGLAMSSRNRRLSESQRRQAPALFKTLSWVGDHLASVPVEELKQQAVKKLEDGGFVVDYVEIANVKDLSPAIDNRGEIVVLAAAFLGEIRLIDNLVID